MDSSKNKQENKKALKVFIPLIIVCGLIGGVIGFFSGSDSVQGVAGSIAEFAGKFIYMISPYCLIITVVVGMAAALHFYRGAKSDFTAWQAAAMSGGDDEEDMDEEVLESIDKKLSRAMLATGVSSIVAFMFFAVEIAYINRYLDENWILYIVVLIAFIGENFGGLRLQQLIVDFEKVLNPEKKGSIYDVKFHKKWTESCDEMEMLLIYKAAYKSYCVTNKACVLAFTVLMVLSFIFSYGLCQTWWSAVCGW